MVKVKLIRGLIWAREAKSPGDEIECTEKEARWLIERSAAIRIVEDVIIPAEIVEPPPPKKRGRKPKVTKE